MPAARVAASSLIRVFPAAVTLALVLATGCGAGSHFISPPAPTPTPAPTPAPAPAPSTSAKAPIHGLVAMGSETFNSNPNVAPDNSLAEPIADPNIYTAAVILVTWKQLQPTGPTSFDPSAIDAALANITVYNVGHPTHPMVGKLRVFAGINAPTWALNLDGTPVSATASNGNTYSIPRYWTANYVAAWTGLQNLLAARYDTDTLLAEVAVSGCASTTAEPFIHDAGTAAIPILKAAGFTDTQYQTCLSTMATQYAAWTQTPLDYTFNAFTGIDTGVGIINTAFPIQIMNAWRASLGTARGILANHGLQPTLTASANPLYAQFQVLGPPLEFQSYGPTVDWNATIALGLTYHPTEIEIWNTTQAGGAAQITPAQLAQWAAEI